MEVARAFTGWTIQDPRLGGGFRFDAAHARQRGEDGAGPRDPGRRRPGGRRDGCSTSSRRTRRRRASSRPSWRGGSSPTRRRRRWSSVPRRGSARPAATCARSCATIVTSPEFFAAEAYAPRSRRRSSSSSARCAPPAPRSPAALPLAAAAARAGHAALHVPAADRLRRPRRRMGQHRRAAEPHELRADADGRPRLATARRAALGAGRSGRRADAADRGRARRDLSARPPPTRRRTRSRLPQEMALVLGSPEFQRR